MPCDQHGISSYKSKRDRKSHSETPLLCFWVAQKHEKTPFSLSESLRSTKKLHLVFLSHSEARKNSIWPLWVAQKHEKTPFGLSESLRSTKKLHLVFLSRSEARKISIWSFWVAQKHRNLLFPYLCRWQKRLFFLFHAYVVDRNTYFLFFMLMSLTETPIFNFWPFWNVQKHEKPLFALSETFRSIKIRHLAFLKCSEA